MRLLRRFAVLRERHRRLVVQAAVFAVAAAGMVSPSAAQTSVAQGVSHDDTLIVSGASGQLGELVVMNLLERGVDAQRLILVSRTPEELERYAAMGASTRFGDFTQPSSLAEAYAGGDRMLLISVTGSAENRPALHKAAIDAAVAAGVDHIAYTSYVNADRYDTSSLAIDHRRTEQLLMESGVAWTLLRNQIYADGLVDQAADIVAAGRLVSDRPDARVAYVTREDCAAAAAGVLATNGHENKAYNITGPDLVGPRELAALASEISGKQVELVVMNENEYIAHLREAGMPDAAIQGTRSFAAELDSPYLRETSTAVADLSGRPATSVRDLLEANRQKLIEAAR